MAGASEVISGATLASAGWLTNASGPVMLVFQSVPPLLPFVSAAAAAVLSAAVAASPDKCQVRPS